MLNPFEEVKKNLSIQEVAQKYGIKALHNNKALCVFHSEKTPSLHFRNDKFFCCYGCGSKGSVIDFVIKLFNLTPLEAAKKISEDFNLGLFDKTLTKQQKLQAKQKIQKKKECELIVADFEKKIKKEETWFLPLFRDYFRWTINNLPPGEDENIDKMRILAQSHISRLEKVLDILQFGKPEDKVKNYNTIKDYRKKLNKKILEIIESEEENDTRRIC